MPARSIPASATRTGTSRTPPARTWRRSAGFATRSRRGSTRCFPNSAPSAPERDRSADQEAHHRGADRELRAVLADLATHVGHLNPAGAQSVNRARELVALLDDVVPDLLGRAAARGRWCPAPIASSWKGPAGRRAHDESSCPSKAAL